MFTVLAAATTTRTCGLALILPPRVTDDYSRLACTGIYRDENGSTTAVVLQRVEEFFAGHGVPIREVISDDAFIYRNSIEFKGTVTEIGAKQYFTKPHYPLQKVKVERLQRTLAIEWAYRKTCISTDERATTFAPDLRYKKQ